MVATGAGANSQSVTDVSASDAQSTTTVFIEGVLDAVTVPGFQKSLDALVARHPTRVVLDLSHLRIIDSCGVGAIVSLYKRVRANSAELTVFGASQQPLAMMKLLHLDRMLEPSKS